MGMPMTRTPRPTLRHHHLNGSNELTDSYAADISHLVKQFGDNTAINDVTLKIQSGRIIGLVGPDGAGKTTLIRLLLGLLLPTSGSISILGLNPTILSLIHI